MLCQYVIPAEARESKKLHFTFFTTGHGGNFVHVSEDLEVAFCHNGKQFRTTLGSQTTRAILRILGSFAAGVTSALGRMNLSTAQCLRFKHFFEPEARF